MLTPLIAGVALSIAGPSPSWFAEAKAVGEVDRAKFESVDDCVEWVTYAYLIGRPTDVRPVLTTLGKHGVLDEPVTQRSLGIHLAQFSNRHAGLLPELTEWAAGQRSGVIRTVALAIWWSGLEDRDALLKGLAAGLPEGSGDRAGIVRLVEQPTPDLRRFAPTAGTLDLWWGAFSATGDTAYIDLILGALPPPGKTAEDLSDQRRILAAAAASWSLGANGQQHPIVLDHLKSRRDKSPGPWAAIEACIADAERRLDDSPSPAPTRPPGGP